MTLTELQWAQQDLFIDGLVHFLDVAGRMQDIQARIEGLQFIHLAFLRRANVKGFVSFDRIRVDVQTRRYSISRAAALLQKRRLGSVVDLESDARYRRFIINRKGREFIDHLDFEIARRMANELGLRSLDSKRYYLFTAALCDLRRVLPNVAVTQGTFEADLDVGEGVGPEEVRELQKITDFAVKPSTSRASMGRSILES